MKFLKSIFETIVLYLHGNDETKAKRVTCLVLAAILGAQGVPAYCKMAYSYIYAWKNNQPPSTLVTATPRSPETYRSSPTAGDGIGTPLAGPHRIAKAKHPHYGIIPLPVGTAAGHSTEGN